MNKALMTILLIAALGSAALAQEKGLPKQAIPDCLGVNIHFAGHETAQLDQIAAAGFRFVRMDFTWDNIEKEKGKYNFTPYDQLLSDLDKRGMRTIFILDYSNPLYNEGISPATDSARKAFADFAGTAAAHFKGRGVIWEIWNEPNGGFWRPKANAADYVKLAKVTYAAVKKADPGCTVIAPALAGGDLGFLEQAYKEGLLEATDAVSVHPYGAARPEDAAKLYKNVRTLAAKYSPDQKQYQVISGEWGYPAVHGFTVEKQGDYLARMFLSNLMNGIPLSIWYDWHDDGPDPNEPEHHFGTVYADYKEKPAYIAMRTLSSELLGYSFALRLDSESDEDYLILFQRNGDYRLAAWTTGKPHSIKTPLDVNGVEITSISGAKQQVKVENGKLKLDLSESPQYVRPLQASRRWALEAGWKINALIERNNDGAAVSVTSTTAGADRGTLKVTGDGLRNFKVSEKQNAAQNNSVVISGSGKFVWNGRPETKLRAQMTVDGLDSPLERNVSLDTSCLPNIEMLPPAKRALIFEATRPSADTKEKLSGKIMLGNTEGLRMEKDSVVFEIAPGKTGTMVRLPLEQEPAAIFSFSYNVITETGASIIRMPARRYSVIETFTDDKAGETVQKYVAELDGDNKVAAEAKLTYVSAPAGAPNSICAKLDYKFDAGWRFVRISCRPMLPIVERPTSVKLWVKGDGKQCAANLRFVANDDQCFQKNYGSTDFSDWKCIETDLSAAGASFWGGSNDGVLRYPIRWDSIFLLDNVLKLRNQGTVYLGPMLLCYD